MTGLSPARHVSGPVGFPSFLPRALSFSSPTLPTLFSDPAKGFGMLEAGRVTDNSYSCNILVTFSSAISSARHVFSRTRKWPANLPVPHGFRIQGAESSLQPQWSDPAFPQLGLIERTSNVYRRPRPAPALLERHSRVGYRPRPTLRTAGFTRPNDTEPHTEKDPYVPRTARAIVFHTRRTSDPAFDPASVRPDRRALPDDAFPRHGRRLPAGTPPSRTTSPRPTVGTKNLSPLPDPSR